MSAGGLDVQTPATKAHRVNKLELAFGVIVPGIILCPMLLFGLLGMVVTGTRGNVPDESKGVMGILIAMSLAGLVAVTTLAAVVWLGPERIKQNSVLRAAVVLGLLVGIAVAGYALWAQRASVAYAARDPGSLILIVPGLLALGGPLIVALRRLPSLLSR